MDSNIVHNRVSPGSVGKVSLLPLPEIPWLPVITKKSLGRLMLSQSTICVKAARSALPL